MNASIDPTTGAGDLNIMDESSSGTGEGSVRATMTGFYTIRPDCSGGELYLDGTDVYQYAFIFAGPNDILMVANSTVPSPSFGETRGHWGRAARQVVTTTPPPAI